MIAHMDFKSGDATTYVGPDGNVTGSTLIIKDSCEDWVYFPIEQPQEPIKYIETELDQRLRKQAFKAIQRQHRRKSR